MRDNIVDTYSSKEAYIYLHIHTQVNNKKKIQRKMSKN